MSNGTSGLERLPPELLSHICEYVGYSHRPTLVSFALTSKRCHSIAKRLLFHTIKFAADSPQQLAEDVFECTSTLQRNAAFADVRIVVLGNCSTRSDNALPWSSRFSGLPLGLVELIDGDQDRLQGLGRHDLFETYPPYPPYQDRSPLWEDADWQTLARLVRRLPALGDLLYASPHQFPSCLLRSLLQCNPHCRLHHFTFQPRTLHLPVIDPHELALVTAPCLHSIWMHYEETDDHHAEAVYSMVRGLAPNLKEVHMSPRTAEDEDGNMLPPPPPWKGLLVGSNASCAVGRLECIELGCKVDYNSRWDRILGADVMDPWASSTDLTYLRSLTISHRVSPEALEGLIRIGNDFQSLTTLLFTCAGKQELAYYDNVKQFLHRLPRLTSLEIFAWHPTMSIASALPTDLRELWLRPQLELGQHLDEAAISELADRCPEIETLALQIRRSRGNATEVALYRALGRFPRLRRLAVTLDASPPPWVLNAPHTVHWRDTIVDPSFDEFDCCYLNRDLFPYRNGHIRDVFINMAVDETLVRTIFQVVSESQARHTTATKPPSLERMTVKVKGGQAFPHQPHLVPVACQLEPFLAALGRRWLLQRDVRDDARDLVHAQEVGKQHRLGWSYMQEKVKPSSPYLLIFRRIWPEDQDGLGDWRDDWRSYPLLVER